MPNNSLSNLILAVPPVSALKKAKGRAIAFAAQPSLASHKNRKPEHADYFPAAIKITSANFGSAVCSE